MIQLVLAAIALILAYLRALVSAQNDVSILGTTLPSATTTSKDISAATVGTSTSTSGPTTITITVNRVSNMFVPENITAQVGDVVKFEFWPTNNSVARSDFGYPCIPYELTGTSRAESSFWSGFKPIVANLAQVNITELPAYYIVINRVTPLWFYNSAPDACIKYQMVGVINPASPTQLAVQKRAAEAATLALSPGEALPQGSTLSSSSSSASSANATASDTPTSTPSSSKSVSPGAIAGIAIGCLASASLVGAGIWSLRHWRKRHIPQGHERKWDGGGGDSGGSSSGKPYSELDATTPRSATVSELPGSGEGTMMSIDGAVVSSSPYAVSPPWTPPPMAAWQAQTGRETVVSELSAYGELRKDQVPGIPPDRRLPQLPEVHREREGPFELKG